MKVVNLLIFILLTNFIYTQNLTKNLQSEFNYKIYKNKNNFLPFKVLDKVNIIFYGNKEYVDLLNNLASRYYKKNFSKVKRENVIICITDSDKIYRKFSFRKKILIYYGTIDSDILLKKFRKFDVIIKIDTITEKNLDKLTQLIFGGLPTDNQIRFHFPDREEIEINLDSLTFKIDSIVYDAMQKKCFPGCQILIAKDKNVIFYKSYGYFTYDSIIKVENNCLYDLASLTKILASAPALMYFYQNKYFDLKDYISKYLKFLKKSELQNVTFIDAMTHQAGLIPYIPFWKKFYLQSDLKDKFFSNNPKKFYLQVAESLFVSKKIKKILFNEIKISKISERTYKYSDIFFYFVPYLVEKFANEDFETFLKKNFYSKLGVNLTFNPYKSFQKNMVVPTEYDSLFRNQLIWGYVHDEGAALVGGISGHAGLFGNAMDVAVMMQMYLDFGVYGGIRFLDSAVVDLWTKYQFAEKGNHRGIVFDKPRFSNEKLKQTASSMASEDSFGHSGFTGTFAWADRKNRLIFVFLSNRVYPTRKNDNLIKYNIRTQLHDVIYSFFEKN